MASRRSRPRPTRCPASSSRSRASSRLRRRSRTAVPCSCRSRCPASSCVSIAMPSRRTPTCASAAAARRRAAARSQPASRVRQTAALPSGMHAPVAGVERDHVERVAVVRVRARRESELGRQAVRDLRPRQSGVVAPVHPDMVLLVQPVVVGRRHHELVDAVADLGVLERPVGAQTLVAGRPRAAVVRRLEDADALDDRPEAGRIVGVREDRGDTEVPRWLVGRIVPRLAAGLALEPAQDLPRLAAVTALEDAGHLRAGEEPPVSGGETRDLRELEPGVAVLEAFARLRPRLAEIEAAPDARAVPFARPGRVDRAGVGVVDGVVDRPALRRTDHAAPTRFALRCSRG